jgi:hypothetical protein
MSELRAWQGTKEKADTLAEFRQHIEADELIAGTYGQTYDGKWRGCAVGCLTGGDNHELYPTLYGIPEQLAYLHDAVFEGLSSVDAKNGQEWSYRFLDVIPEGTDLSRIFSQLVVWWFEDYGLLNLYPDTQHKSALIQVVTLHKRVIAGETVTETEWKDAADAAYAARAAAYAADAADAARAAAYAADAADAARAAAYAADAADAARAAADAARAADFWQRLADKLLGLLGAA